MSVRAVTWALDADIGAATTKLVLVILADCANDETGQCWPSMAYIGRRCQVSIKSVQRCLRRLERKGLIETDQRVGRASVFTLLIGGPVKLTGVTQDISPSVTMVSDDPGQLESDRTVIEPPESLSSLEDSSLTQGVSEERSSGRWNFDAFWEQYPHKVGKRAAVKAFDAARKRKGSFVDLMLGLLRYVSKTDDRPWCNPATWLNQDRWLDQPAAGGNHGPHRKTLTERGRELIAEAVAREADLGGGSVAGGNLSLWPVPEHAKGR